MGFSNKPHLVFDKLKDGRKQVRKNVSLPSSKFFIRLCSWEQPPLPMPLKEGTVPWAMQQLTLLDPTTDNRDYSIHQGITMAGVAGRRSNVKYERRNTKQLLAGLT